jgi:hypothetical protein
MTTVSTISLDATSTNAPSHASGVVRQEVGKCNRERYQRQVRLFKVILLLMFVFFICRLPSWIYTIYKLNNDADSNIHWVLNYSFGMLVLLNCALNPYLYTFMSETIKVVSFLGNVIRMIFKCKGVDVE